MTSNDLKQSMMLTSGASGRINALFSIRSLRSLLMLINAFVLLLLFPFRVKWNTTKPSSSSSEEMTTTTTTTTITEKENSNNNKKAVVRVPVPWWKRGGAAAVDQEVAVRRGIAIKRVKQDDDWNSVIRDYSLFVNSRGDTLFTQSSTPVSITIRGVVVLMHGLNEHSGRYSEFAKQLNANGFKVYGMDWIGHGGSDGLHAYVHSLDDPVRDLKSYLEKVMAENPGLPYFCFGHSTGAAIILKASLDPKIQSRLTGIVLTSPAVGVQPTHSVFVDCTSIGLDPLPILSNSFMRVLAPLIAFLLPRYQVTGAQKGMPVSRDPAALVAKYSDPLVYTGSIRVRTGYEILRITTFLKQNLKRVKVPFLVLHGTADTVTDPEASQKLYEEASSTDKTLKLCEGLLHDLLFEPEREEIASHIIEWLNSRV
ncbi:hypothetical protein ACFE04_022090 [Oxalis oulophora]